MRKEHPAEEKDTVVFRGRVLGGLEPTRAMGDARYKWPPGLGAKLQAAFLPGRARNEPPHYHTPPYVTAEPVVTTRDLPPAGEGRRFLVLATDGLFDRLGSDEVVGLVGQWLDRQTRGELGSGTMSRSQLLKTVVASEDSVVSPHSSAKDGAGAAKTTFVFEDTNVAVRVRDRELG